MFSITNYTTQVLHDLPVRRLDMCVGCVMETNNLTSIDHYYLTSGFHVVSTFVIWHMHLWHYQKKR